MPVLFPGQALWGINRRPFSHALSLPTGPEAGPSPGAVVDPAQVSEAPRLQAWKIRLETLHSALSGARFSCTTPGSSTLPSRGRSAQVSPPSC